VVGDESVANRCFHVSESPPLPFRTPLRLALLALSAPIVVAAQEHPDVSSVGNGARAVGLGFATTALADDIYSIGWNPAGLSRLTRRELAFTGRLLVVVTSATADDFNPIGFPVLTGAGEITGAVDALEFAGAAVPFRVFGRTVTPAIAYRRFTEGVRAGTFETRIRQSNARFTGSTVYATTGGLRAISPSLGVEITPKVRVGVTANILSGSSDYTIRGPFPYEFHGRETGYKGLALEAGTLVTLRDGLTLGVHLALPHELSYQWDNDTTVRNVTRTAPLALATGLALELSSTSRLSADVRYSPWSSSSYTNDANGDTVKTSVGKNDAASVHFGFERDRERELQNIYGVATGTRRTRQRVGLLARQTTMVDLDSDAIRVFGVSAGQSWLFESVVVDFGMMYLRSTRYARSETVALRMHIASNDLVVSFGLRRRF